MDLKLAAFDNRFTKLRCLFNDNINKLEQDLENKINFSDLDKIHTKLNRIKQQQLKNSSKI